MKLCRIAVLAYEYGDVPMGREHGYEEKDLENAIEYCADLLVQGFRYEPMDNFSLTGFIRWANLILKGKK